MVYVYYLRPHALVTLGVLSTGICDLLHVVLTDGSTTAFLPRFLFGAGESAFTLFLRVGGSKSVAALISFCRFPVIFNFH